MSQKNRQRIHLIYNILFTAVTIIAGACFIVACYQIYRTGLQSSGQIYTRQIVAAAFRTIAVPVYLCLALTIGGFILHLALPLEAKKAAPEKNLPLILQRLQAKTDLANCDEQLRSAIAAQQKSRRLHTIISAALTTICSVIFLIYACNGSNWAPVAQVTDSMIKAMAWFVPCVSIPLAYIIFTAYFCRKSLQKEIELTRQASTQAPKQSEKPASKVRKPLLTLGIRLAIVAIGIGFIVYGATNGGIEGVVAKAVAICTECIGLG